MKTSVLEHFCRVFSEIPFNRTLGLTLDTITEDHIMISFTMKADFVGNYLQGILHGGVISSVLDMAGGVAAMLAAIEKRDPDNLEKLAAVLGKSSTINLNIDYLQPGKGDRFFAKALVTHAGNKITFTRMELHNQEDDLIATGTAAYLIG